jgi:flavin-dependent dehydrogenase
MRGLDIDDGTAASDASGAAGPIATDIVVLGGGPAGAAAALTLLRYSQLRVTLIERSAYDRWRPGEALAPSALPFLDYLDASAAVDIREHLPARGFAAAWGSPQLSVHDFLFSGRSQGWHLDRSRFDRALTRLVAARGGEVMQEAVVTGQHFAAGAWRFQVQRGSHRAERVITARFALDATGRRAGLARPRGARREIDDTLISLVGICPAASDRGDSPLTVIEAAPCGWWYSTRLPGDRIVAAFMTDADIIRANRLRSSAAWWDFAQATVQTGHRLGGPPADARIQVSPAFSQILDPVAGEGWIATGDAAVSFDPLSGMGIGYALASGIGAARAAHDVLTARGSLVDEYAASVRGHYQQYLRRKQQYYAMESRWPASPFWARRQADARSGASNSL